MAHIPSPMSMFRSILALLSGKKNNSNINRELPFTVMLFTLMSASGMAVYDSWKKMCRVSLLPETQKEAKEMLRQVDVLGYDPLTVMYKKADEATSKTYRDFLAGYVSSIRSGSNVVNFLRSKLRSILDVQSATAFRSIERLGTLVEAYAVMMIVTLCIYILYVVMSATASSEYLSVGLSISTSEPLMYALIFLATPFITIVFMAIANLAHQSTLITVKEAYRTAAISGIAAIGVFGAVTLLPQLGFIIETITLPGFVTLCLMPISIPAAIIYRKIARANSAAEESMPSFLRDVTESRKIGLSPVKSIVHATERTDYRSFNRVLKSVRSQIEWGVPLRKIFGNIKKRIEYYQNGITKATGRVEKLVKQQDGIQASTRSLEEYSTEVSMIPQSLNSAKVFCAQLGSAVSALGGVSSRSTPSFMSMLGGVLQDSYRKSINSRSGYSSSSEP